MTPTSPLVPPVLRLPLSRILPPFVVNRLASGPPVLGTWIRDWDGTLDPAGSGRSVTKDPWTSSTRGPGKCETGRLRLVHPKGHNEKFVEDEVTLRSKDSRPWDTIWKVPSPLRNVSPTRVSTVFLLIWLFYMKEIRSTPGLCHFLVSKIGPLHPLPRGFWSMTSWTSNCYGWSHNFGRHFLFLFLLRVFLDKWKLIRWQKVWINWYLVKNVEWIMEEYFVNTLRYNLEKDKRRPK